ncbi:MAG: T9SS type A sorting domain-containing protein [Muribaculaceae bacterium]
MYSIAGSKVASLPIANGIVDLSMLGAGAYIAMVGDNNERTTVKFIKQ